MWDQNEIAKARARLEAQERQRAIEEYNNQKAQLDNKYNNGGLGGFLGGIIGGIGKGIGDIGNSVIDMLGSGVASARDLGSILTTGKSAGENEKWLMSRRGTDNAQDAYAKTAGQALNAATTLASTAVPMAGAGGAAAKVLGGTAANTAAGAVGGLADELQQQGKDANLESAANRAISGAAAGLVTGGLNKKIGNATGNISSKLLNNKLATSAVGRGALSGAVGGATGAGTSAALSGGDIGQAALQGGLSGAAAGGVQGGLMSAAQGIGGKLRDRAWGVGNTNKTQQPALESEAIDQFQEKVAEATKNPIDERKLAQFELIQEKNPMLDDYHTGIRSVDEIKTFGENVAAYNSNSEDFVYPDWTIDNARAAAKNGKVTIYSSKPIEEGVFVSPSKMMAQDYAGSGKVYSKEIPLNDVAWISGDEGNYAPIKETTKIVRIEEPTAKIKNRNRVQQIGEELQQNARETKWQGLYENLDRKTAERASETRAPQQLSEMGVNPENYAEYAKTSDYVNRQVSKIAKDSGVKVEIPDLADRLSVENTTVILSDPAARKYKNIIKQIVADGDTPTQYSASYLIEKSRELGQKAASLRGNVDDVKSLRAALTDAKYMLRDAATTALEDAGVTGDLTTDYIARGLKKLGANQDVIDYYSAPNGENAPNAADYIRRTSLFEQARDMANDMATEKLSRNASKGKTNFLQQGLAYVGLDKPIETIGRNVIAPIAGKAQDIVGKGVAAIGNRLDNANLANSQLNPAVYNLIGRAAGQQGAANNVQSARKAQEYQTLENMFGGLAGGSQGLTGAQSATNMMGAYPTAQTSQIEAQLADITNGMRLAMAAGDYTAYNQLADLYKTAYNTYQMQVKMADTGTSNAKLSKTQQQANAAALALNELENMNPDYGYKVKDIPLLNLVNLAGNKYSSTADSLAMQIGYMLSGANIKEEEARKIGSAYVPQPFDDDATRRYKLQQARQIIQQYQNTYTTDDNNNNNQLAMAY